MMKNFEKYLLLFALIFGTSSVQATVIYEGAVTDATGDASSCCDIVFASAQVDDMNMLTLDVRFGAGFDSSLAAAFFMFDTDQDVTTGHPGIAASGTIDNTLLGVDYMVWMGGGATEAQAMEYVSFNNFATTGIVSANILSDGFTAQLDMALLGGDEGLMNIKLVSVQCTDPNLGYNCPNYGINDVVTDVGYAPWQTTAVPEPATVLLLGLGLLGMASVKRRR